MNDQNAPFFVDNEKITLKSNGEWIADGTEITHEPTRKLFSRSIVKKEGRYYLVVGRETKEIEIEDTPYFVIRIEGNPGDGWTLQLNDGTSEPLALETLKYTPGRLVCSVKNSLFEAKFLHAPYHEFLNHAMKTKNGYEMKMGNRKITLQK